MLFLGGKELINQVARVRIKIAPDAGAFRQLRSEIENDLKRQVRNNFTDLRPFIEDAINAGVESNKDDFVPNSREVAELGIGSNGSPDTSRTEGAYKQMRTDSRSPITNFSIRKQRPTARDDLIGAILVTINEEELLNSNLARVPTPDSSVIDEIPWLRWLINGAPINPDFQFVSRRLGGSISRTGQGIMIRGGLWSFPPARFGAFNRLIREIEERIVGFIQDDIGDIL